MPTTRRQTMTALRRRPSSATIPPRTRPTRRPPSNRPVSALPWHGAQTCTQRPRGFPWLWPRDRRGSNTKSARSHLDVTAGCLTTVADTHGRIASTSGGAFARSCSATQPRHGARDPLDRSEHRVRLPTPRPTTARVLPGFKAFARTTRQDPVRRLVAPDASCRSSAAMWVYTALKALKDSATVGGHVAPHEAVGGGDQLELFLAA